MTLVARMAGRRGSSKNKKKADSGGLKWPCIRVENTSSVVWW